MKKMISLLMAIVLLCCMLVSLVPDAYAAENLSAPVKTSNVGDYEYQYGRWANPIKSYLVPNSDATFSRVEYTGDAVTVETYDSGLKFVSGFTVDMELPLFGGFYSGTNRNFLVFGQKNSAETDETEVLRVVSYTKDWKRIASASLYGANTYIPFDGGTLRFAEYNGYLYIRTAHEMYMSSDGLHHQANMTLNVRISDMVITDSFYRVMNINYGYVSHSFNQFIAIDGTDLVAVDHGDANPRSVVLTKYNAPAGQDKFMVSALKPVGNGSYQYVYVKYTEVLPISGSYGANDTGVALGGFEISDSAYLIAGNTVEQGDNYDARGQRNIFVSATAKGDLSTAKTTVNYLTAYNTDDAVTVSNPHFTKVSSNKYMVLWTESTAETEVLRYAFVDGNGKLMGKIYYGKGMLSDCKPIVSGGKLIWYVTNASAPAFFTIDLNNPETLTHEHLYTYSYIKYPAYTADGALSSVCGICGRAGEDVVIPAIQNSDAYTLYATVTKPTCTKDGSGKYQWKDAVFYGVTNYIYTAKIPATGHKYTNGICENCGDTLTIPNVTITKTVGHSTGIILYWDAVEGGDIYQIYRLNGSSWELLKNTRSLAYKDETAVPGVRHYYKIVARNGDLKSDIRTTASAGAVRPAATLANVRINKTVGHSTGNILYWDAVEGAKLYQIYRLDSGSWTLLKNTGSLAYKDETAPVGVKAYYKMVARNGDNKSDISATASVGVVRPAGAVTKLDNVTITQVKPHSTGNILYWNAVNNAKIYQVYRLEKGSWVLLKNTGSLGYKDETAPVGVKCYYKIVARNGDVKSDIATTASASATRP